MPTASEAVAEQLAGGGPFRIAGAGTKLGWGRPVDAEPLRTAALDRIVEHEAGDFTAVLEAGVPLAVAQETFAKAGQMLALDPPEGGTIGGVVATADSGPLRHRYGAPRDLVIGMTLALPDGTLARSGGRVIKNVAGYDLPKLAAGAHGTLGVITQVCVRLHPRPSRTATAVFRHDDPDRLQQIALELNHRPLEAEALDVRWQDGEGAILARFAGAAALERAQALGGETVDDDDHLWEAQRAGQRHPHKRVGSPHPTFVVRVAALPSDLARVIRAAPDAKIVGRAGVGTFWIVGSGDPTLVLGLRERLRPHPCVVTDAPEELRREIDPWDIPDGPEKELMRRVKARFDPDDKCNPGLML